MIWDHRQQFYSDDGIQGLSWILEVDGELEKRVKPKMDMDRHPGGSQ